MKTISKAKLYWLLQIVGWYAFFSFNEFFINTDSAASGRLIFLAYNPPLGIALTHFYRQYLKNFLKKNQSVILPWRLILLAWLLIVAIFYLLNLIILSSVMHAKGLPFKDNDYLVLTWVSFMLATPWFLIYHAYKFAQMAINRTKESARLESLLHEAELENLKNQLNPHFLFNALNSIKALTISDPTSARDAITRLSDLLRLSLIYGKREGLLIQEEMELVEDYLVLEKIRFERRMTYLIEIASDTKHLIIPPMTIQTLAENAIKHGISKRKQGGTIVIRIELKNSILEIKVRNSGILKMELGGIGLTNLQRRLKIMDPNSKFSIVQEDEEHVLAAIYLNIK